MVNRIITVLSLVCGLPSFVYIFTGDTTCTIILAIITLVVCIAAFLFESWAKNNSGLFTNAVCYFFDHERDYQFLSREAEYASEDGVIWRFEKDFLVKINRDDVKSIPDFFQWSADSREAVLSYTDHNLNQSGNITAIGADGARSTYSIPLRSRARNTEAQVSSCLSNLRDLQRRARPFFTIEITKKTRFLQMTVQLDKQYRASTPSFKIKKGSRDITSGAGGVLFDYTDSEISLKVNYPRKGFTYMLCW